MGGGVDSWAGGVTETAGVGVGAGAGENSGAARPACGRVGAAGSSRAGAGAGAGGNRRGLDCWGAKLVAAGSASPTELAIGVLSNSASGAFTAVVRRAGSCASAGFVPVATDGGAVGVVDVGVGAAIAANMLRRASARALKASCSLANCCSTASFALP